MRIAVDFAGRPGTIRERAELEGLVRFLCQKLGFVRYQDGPRLILISPFDPEVDRPGVTAAQRTATDLYRHLQRTFNPDQPTTERPGILADPIYFQTLAQGTDRFNYTDVHRILAPEQRPTAFPVQEMTPAPDDVQRPPMYDEVVGLHRHPPVPPVAERPADPGPDRCRSIAETVPAPAPAGPAQPAASPADLVAALAS